MKIEELWNNVREYVGVEPLPVDKLGELLSNLVSKYGEDIYSRPADLGKAMKEFGASDTQIWQVALVVGINGFRDLMEKDGRVQQADLERYVSNVLHETGLTRTVTLSLVSAIALSLGIAFDYVASEQRRGVQDWGAYVIPAGAYEAELAAIEKIIAEKGVSSSLSETQVERLRALSSAGVSQAKYYLGERIVARAEENKTDPQVGLEYLKDAAEAGYPPAAAALGDYYYNNWSADNWNSAYGYYTGCGALSLTENRQNAVLNILNHGEYNRKLIFSSIWLIAAMLFCVVMAPGAGLFAAHRIIGGILVAISVMLIAVALMHHRVKPYDNFYWLPFGLYVIWFLYVAIRVIW